MHRPQLKQVLTPVFLLALVLLLLNDAWWKWEFGNWWTGKLSDFAGLFAFGLVAALWVGRSRQAWVLTEDALVGADGRKAPRVAGHIAYWFAWAGYLGDESDFFDG